jgi:hypothetical protein
MKRLIFLSMFLAGLPALADTYESGLAEGRGSCQFVVKQLDPQDLADQNEFPNNPHAYIPMVSPNPIVVGYADGLRIGMQECSQAAVQLAHFPKASYSCLQSNEGTDAALLGIAAGETRKEAASRALLKCLERNKDLPSYCFQTWVYCFKR